MKHTDVKEWCAIETRTGQKEWFSVNNVDYETFEGLCYAD